MSVFVVDTNVFSRALKNLDMKVFADDIYKSWSNGMINDTIISVDEVYNELDSIWGAKDPKGKIKQQCEWLKQHKSAFKNLTDAEGRIVAEIFKSKKFREGVKEKSLREGTPEADAILVAKAKCVNGIIVTAESNSKPNSEKIPNICIQFDVPYISIDGFYQMLKNVSGGKSELENVTVFYELDTGDEK